MKGNKTHRHDRNPLEKQLHDNFVAENDMENISRIVFDTTDGIRLVDFCDDREAAIVISTIQWLGSSVGQDFLSRNGFKNNQ
jgi:hypothetical protein